MRRPGFPARKIRDGGWIRPRALSGVPLSVLTSRCSGDELIHPSTLSVAPDGSLSILQCDAARLGSSDRNRSWVNRLLGLNNGIWSGMADAGLGVGMGSMVESDVSMGQLGDTQRRLDAVLNNASVSIILMDDRQHCIYMNRAAEMLTGFTLDEVLALNCPLHDIVHHTRPDGSHFPLAECAIDRAFPEHNQTQGEETFVHKDGSFYPVAFTASPIRDEASRTIGTIIEVRDIREEKAARERQRLLIDELNHRVKNTLSAVQSIAYQSLKGVDADARQAFEGRLVALSGAHNVLTKEGWTGASLFTAIETAIAAYRTPTRFKLAGTDHPLAPKMVVALSMVIHELATNAVKYGALSVPEGSVRIEWQVVRQDAGSERLAMRWEEAGGPPVEVPTRKGFGTRLLERQVSMEFNGSIQLQYRPSGLLCLMDLGLPRSDSADAAISAKAASTAS